MESVIGHILLSVTNYIVLAIIVYFGELAM